MRVVFIGDEVTAAAYRLAGVEIRVLPQPAGADRVANALREAVDDPEAALVLVTTECARSLPSDELMGFLANTATPVLPVDDAGGRVEPIDLAQWIRGQIVA